MRRRSRQNDRPRVLAWRPRFRRRTRAASAGALPRDLDVVEGKDAVADDLALFMTLTSEEDDIVGAGLGNRGGNGLAPAANLSRFGCARHHFPADEGGILG